MSPGSYRMAIAAFGHLDIMVNNAGITSGGAPVHAQDWDLWDRIFDVNLKGVAFGMKHVLPHMIARKLWADHQHLLATGA